MLTPMLISALVASAAPDGGQSVLVLDLSETTSDRKLAELATELVASSVAERPSISVITTNDLRKVSELEAQKSVMNCEDDSCLAELANAMGARYVVSGTIGKLESSYITTLTLFDSDEARSVGRKSVQAKSLDELPAVINTAVASLFGPFAVKEPSPPPAEGAMSTTGWLGIGAVAVGASAFAIGGLGALFSELTTQDKSAPLADKEAALATGRIMLVVAGAGAAIAAGGGALLWLE